MRLHIQSKSKSALRQTWITPRLAWLSLRFAWVTPRFACLWLALVNRHGNTIHLKVIFERLLSGLSRRFLGTVQHRKWSSDRKWSPHWTANDPEQQMIPEVDCKWFCRKTRNGVEFWFLVFFIIYFFILFSSSNDSLRKCKENMLTT